MAVLLRGAYDEVGKFQPEGQRREGERSGVFQNEVGKSLEKEAQLQQKIEEMDSFTFYLA